MNKNLIHETVNILGAEVFDVCSRVMLELILKFSFSSKSELIMNFGSSTGNSTMIKSDFLSPSNSVVYVKGFEATLIVPFPCRLSPLKLPV